MSNQDFPELTQEWDPIISLLAYCTLGHWYGGRIKAQTILLGKEANC